MKIGGKYSHLNGEEYLIVHKPRLWEEVKKVIQEVNAEKHRNKASKNKKTMGQLFYSPVHMNQDFENRFNDLGWKERRDNFYVTDDERLARRIHDIPVDEQKSVLESEGRKLIRSYNQTDFFKERVAIEVQIGKCYFVAHDLFAKHLSFFVSDMIDVGIKVLPMKSLELEMSAGIPHYERDLLNVIRRGRGVPAVPFVLIGVEP